MSKYDNINTAGELLREVISNGLSTEQEDRNRAADIFGNSSVSDLAELANSKDEISGKWKADTFYFIAFNIWNWRDAVNFYNQHSNPATAEHERVVKKFSELNTRHERLKEANEALKEELKKMEGVFSDLGAAKHRILELENQHIDEIAKRDTEIMKLKAMLFDQMMKSA